MSSRLAVLVTPRDGLHYQKLLYRDIEASGVRVHYDQGPTPSQTLNVMFKPAVLIWHRLHGCRILHIHWLFQFSLPWASESDWARLLMQWWFALYIQTAHLLGYAIIWTAHDLVPHTPIFANDGKARDLLIAKASIVIALSEATATELRALGARRVRVVPMASYSDPYRVTLTDSQARASFGFDDDDVVVSLIGRVEPYKGADLLLKSLAQLPGTSKVKVLLAGTCADDTYRYELNQLASAVRDRAIVQLEWITDDDLARYFQATNVAVFPFREVTNSASVLLAQSFGKPAVIPDLASLRDIPDNAVLRFDPERESLVQVLERVEQLTKAEYEALSVASLAWAQRRDWETAAKDTVDAYRSALGGQKRFPRRATR